MTTDHFLLYLTFILTFILYTFAIAGATYLYLALRIANNTRKKAETQREQYYELTPEQVQAMFNMGRQQKKEKGDEKGPQAAEFPPHAGLYL